MVTFVGNILVKKVYELKEISLVQRAIRTEYPKDGTPSYSVIKNILSNFEKYGSVAVATKTQKFRSKTRNGQKTARKPGLRFSLVIIVNQERGICCWCFANSSISYLS